MTTLPSDETKRTITLHPGDTVLIIRPAEDGDKFKTLVYQNKIGMTKDDSMFFHVLARGLALTVVEKIDEVFERGVKAIDEPFRQLRPVDEHGNEIVRLDIRNLEPKGNA